MSLNKDAWLKARLEAVLIAALKAPGNESRFRRANLIHDEGPDGASLVADWPTRFAELPLLRREDVRQRPEQFLATVDDIVYRGMTSGSRQRSYLFFANRDWNRTRIQSRQDFLDGWGIDVNTPIINIASRLMPGRPGDSAIAGPLDNDLIALLKQSLQAAPAALRGYPSRLCDLASVLPQPLPPIRAVICTGEPLYEHQQVLLQERFQAPVVNEYGCHEAAASGFSCPEVGRIHLDERRCLYEVIDGALVTTDLWNETMPLIRYQCGDFVRLHPSPCPCGRAGATVEMLGRLEDRVRTPRGLQPVGALSMPRLPGILHYRIRRQSADQVAAWAQVETAQPLASGVAARSLQTWTEDTFGSVALHLTPAIAQLPTQPVESWSDDQWVTTMTQKSIGDWLSGNAMPAGEASDTATLLKHLLNPRIIGVTLPSAIRQQIACLAESPVAANPTVEIIKARVLLMASGGLCGQAAQTTYATAVQRLDALPDPPALATRLDTLIPSLHLPSAIARAAWQEPFSCDRIPLDPLNVHHLLLAFEAALRCQPLGQRSLMARRLNPILAVLIGDLDFSAASFTVAHLHHWVTLFQNTMLPSPAISKTLPNFAAHWLRWRQQLIQNAEQAAPLFAHLETAATSPAERARLTIEQGYCALLQGQRLAPEKWLPSIETHTAGQDSEGPQNSSALMPWRPILSALIAPLHEQGQPETAYRFLAAMSVPSRQRSAFDRWTTQFNQKQTVLMDLAPR